MSPYPKLADSYEKINGILTKVLFDSGHFPHRLAMMYAGQMVETAYALLVLGKSKSSASNHLLVRSIFETGVRLMYLAAEPVNHYPNLELEDCVSKEKALNAFPEADLSKKMREALLQVRQRIAILRKADAKSLPIEQMLKSLNAEIAYRHFRRLSSSVHSQILGLSHQFLEERDGRFEVRFFRPCSEDQMFYANELASFFIDSIEDSLLKLKVELP
jgi:Family of unknown function (DUF5677)